MVYCFIILDIEKEEVVYMGHNDLLFEEMKQIIKILNDDLSPDAKKKELSKLKRATSPSQNRRIEYYQKMSELL